VARAGKDRAEVLARKSEARSNGAVEHEKLVAAGGDAALDAEEVAKRRAFRYRLGTVFAVRRTRALTGIREPMA
jgi:hypothetical protein